MTRATGPALLWLQAGVLLVVIVLVLPGRPAAGRPVPTTSLVTDATAALRPEVSGVGARRRR